MTLASSGIISIGGSTSNRSINLELGRSATATSNLNETSLRDLADVSSGSISLDDFYGKSAWEATGNEAIGTWPVVFGSLTHPSPWGVKSQTRSTIAEVTAIVQFKVDETNNRIIMQYDTEDNQSPISFAEAYITYTDLDISQSSTWEVLADWNYTWTPGTGSNAATITEPSSSFDNAYRTLNTSNYIGYTWKVTANSGNETGTISSAFGQNEGVIFYLRNTDGGGTVRTVNSGWKAINLSATRGTTSGPGGPE
jgi:hypothetical protein